MQIGELIDKIYMLKAKRDQITAMYDDQIKLMTAELDGMMKAAKETKAAGTVAQAYPRKVTSTEVDWAKLYVFIERNHALDLLQRRVMVSAAEARIAAGETIPGLKLETRTELMIAGLKERK